MSQIVHPVILCGGSGTRLWPLSTPDRPKQFLALTSDKSMIQETVARFSESKVTSLSFSSPLIIGSERHAALLEQTFPDERKILEPFGRNSAPAVAAASLSHDPHDLLLILPADHDIRDVASFHKAIESAAVAAEDGAIVTFGIQPTHPATGYGYIRASSPSSAAEALPVEQFVEKPNLATAQGYLDTGGYFWNAGIFLFKARVMLDALQNHAPDVLTGTQNAIPKDIESTIHLDPVAFGATPSISIDYAVMEQAANVKTVPVSMGWSDVGGYRALHELLTDAETENHTSGPVHIQNSTGSYIRSEGPVISVNGVTDMVVVATTDEVMITPMNNDAAVKELGKAVQTGCYTFGVSAKLCKRARDWLWTAFDFWSEKGWDTERGGFVEQLDMDGAPDLLADRRIRVQARQVFSFAKALELGWPDADKARMLVDKGLEYIDSKLRHPDGGWVHVVNANGEPIDDKRDLYDHAFIILAGATAYQATGSSLALKLADEAIDFIDAELKDHQHGGWFEAKPTSLPRRANPHMHLLEAMLAYHSATNCNEALERANEVVRLFETRFFDPATDVMAEFFTENWTSETAPSETIFEPGHHYEWATLLFLHEQLTGHDTASWRRRIIQKADCIGLNTENGFVFNALRANGKIVSQTSRLWPQLERFRSYLFHAKDLRNGPLEEQMLSVFEGYLDHGPDGTWWDELESTGRPVSRTVPGSMLYHLVTFFEPLATGWLD